GLDRDAALDEGTALRGNRREAMSAGIDVQGIERERRLAAADALVARQHRGCDAGRRLLPLGDGALPLARNLLAPSREGLALRGLLRSQLRERLFRLRGPPL